MRNGQRAFTVLLSIIIVAPLLSGCALRAQGREVEQLLIVQAMGLDRTAGGVCVSLASGAMDANVQVSPVLNSLRRPDMLFCATSSVSIVAV